MNQFNKDFVVANQKLAELLKMERSQEEQEEVDKILASHKDPQKRVEMIEEVDRRSKRRFSEEDLRATPQRKRKAPAQPPAASSTSQDRGGGGGFLSFLFGGGRREISDFGEQTGALKSRLLGTQLELSGSAIQLLKRYPAKDVAVMFKRLAIILQEAWKWVDVDSYNLLVAYYRMLEGYFDLSSTVAEGARDPQIILKQGNKFFSNFLILQQDNGYLKKTASALETVFEKQADETMYKKVRAPFQSFFVPHKNQEVSMLDVLKGLHALIKKKVPATEELDLYYQVKKVSDKEYNVRPELKAKIRKYFDNINQELEVVEDDLEYLNMVKNDLLTQNDDGKYVFDTLKEVLTLSLQEHGLFDEKLSAEIKKIIKSAPSLLIEVTGFVTNHFAPILLGKIAISGNKSQIAVFEHHILSGQMAELDNELTQMNKLKMKYPNADLTLDSFLKMKPTTEDKSDKAPQGASDDDQIEQQFFQVSKKMVETYYTLGQTLAQVLFNQHKAEKLPYNEKNPLRQNADEPIKEIKNEPHYIPFYSDRIEGKGALSGYSIFDGILLATRLSYHLALLFRQPELIKFLKSESELNNRYQEIKSNTDGVGA